MYISLSIYIYIYTQLQQYACICVYHTYSQWRQITTLVIQDPLRDFGLRKQGSLLCDSLMAHPILWGRGLHYLSNTCVLQTRRVMWLVAMILDAIHNA